MGNRGSHRGIFDVYTIELHLISVMPGGRYALYDRLRFPRPWTEQSGVRPTSSCTSYSLRATRPSVGAVRARVPSGA